MRIDALILAAGSGERFGGSVPKAFAELGGVPIVVRSVRTAAAAGVERIVVVVGRTDLARVARELLADIETAEIHVVLGGATRIDSTRLGLDALAADDGDIVVVHDAARPLATVGSFERVIAAVRAGAEGATAVVPSTDTIATTGAGRVLAVPDRSTIVRVQTPQAFRRGALREAHAAAAKAGDTTPTDDAGLMLRYLPTVVIAAVPGDDANLKITHATDLELAARLIPDG